MAKSRSKAASRSSSSKSARRKTATRSAKNSPKKSTRSGRFDSGDAAARPPLKAGDVPDDIELLNVHRYPESMPASVVAFVRNDRNCQRRLEELVKGTPGKRGQSGFNQLFQQKLDESSEGPGPAPTVYRADDAKSGGGASGVSEVPGANQNRPAPAAPPPPAGGVGGFFRKLFS